MPPYSEIGTITLEEELNAKAIQALERVMEDFETGRADGSQAVYALQAIHESVAGCVNMDVTELIAQASRQVSEDGEKHVQRQLYHRQGDFVLVGRIVGDDKLLVTKHIGDDNESREIKEFMSANEARVGAKKIGEILVKKGYRVA